MLTAHYTMVLVQRVEAAKTLRLQQFNSILCRGQLRPFLLMVSQLAGSGHARGEYPAHGEPVEP